MKDAFVCSASYHAWGVVLGIGPVLSLNSGCMRECNTRLDLFDS